MTPPAQRLGHNGMCDLIDQSLPAEYQLPLDERSNGTATELHETRATQIDAGHQPGPGPATSRAAA
jgi:hypothetical protein